MNMRTVTVEIINEKAMDLLENLQLLKLIRLKSDISVNEKATTDWSKYKGAMTKQPLSEVNQQLSELRNEWD